MKWQKPNAFDQIIQVIQGTGGNPIVVSTNGKLIPHNEDSVLVFYFVP